MISVLKQILNVAIFLFMAFLLGNAMYIRYERPIREGLEGEVGSCDIKDSTKPIELAAAFEKVNKQMDMIRSLTGSTKPAVPLKIDKSGDPEYLVITNLKLLINNGIEKNETSLKTIYDQYIGNNEITLLTTELNAIQTVTLTTPPVKITSFELPPAVPDPVAIHGKEVGLMCRMKTAIDGHQTLLDRILKKSSEE